LAVGEGVAAAEETEQRKRAMTNFIFDVLVKDGIDWMMNDNVPSIER
jgi:hypothetical protein